MNAAGFSRRIFVVSSFRPSRFWMCANGRTTPSRYGTISPSSRNSPGIARTAATTSGKLSSVRSIVRV
jgi:hypothetical protein